jgi:hypothetical protein
VKCLGKTNRGETTKVSIRLTAAAKERIEKVAENLNLSKAGVIVFALANIIDKFPDKQTVLNMESKYDLEPNHFPVTINMELAEKLNAIRDEYKIKKNMLFGLVISDYFETQIEDHLLKNYKASEVAEPKPVYITLNKDLKKKVDDYSEKNYIPLSGLVSYSILNDGMDTLPHYENNEMETVITRIPNYLSEIVKEESARLHVRESFYIELCLYKAFLSDDKIFDNE